MGMDGGGRGERRAGLGMRDVSTAHTTAGWYRAGNGLEQKEKQADGVWLQDENRECNASGLASRYQ